MERGGEVGGGPDAKVESDGEKRIVITGQEGGEGSVKRGEACFSDWIEQHFRLCSVAHCMRIAYSY